MYEVETKVNKLILLFFLDKMDVPLTDGIIQEICNYHNNWLTYMDCIQSLSQLLESEFVCKTKHDNTTYYGITPEGRMCLAHFYTQIPVSMRAEITDYVKANRMYFRRKQEYSANYRKNSDGTYTVQLKITDWAQTPISLTVVVPDKETAKRTIECWKNKAAEIYTFIYERLTE